MQYKYDLHCHTNPVSVCAKLTAKELVQLYIDNGYDGIVLTNHINVQTFMHLPTSRWTDMMDYYLSDYYKVCDAANGKLTVLLGTEIRFAENNNDYLVYGIVPDFLRRNTNLIHIGIHKFSQIAKEQGALVFQAHPFRNHMSITNPELLDGIEIFNGNPRHDSRNSFAKLWCKTYGLLACAGSDTHQKVDIGSGIVTEKRITDNKTLLETLKNGSFEILHNDP